MGSPLGPLLANVFMCSIEENLEQHGQLPRYYRRYVDDTLTVMPDRITVGQFLDTLNSAHPSVKFTMEIEREGSLPFLGTAHQRLRARCTSKEPTRVSFWISRVTLTLNTSAA